MLPQDRHGCQASSWNRTLWPPVVQCAEEVSQSCDLFPHSPLPIEYSVPPILSFFDASAAQACDRCATASCGDQSLFGRAFPCPNGSCSSGNSNVLLASICCFTMCNRQQFPAAFFREVCGCSLPQDAGGGHVMRTRKQKKTLSLRTRQPHGLCETGQKSSRRFGSWRWVVSEFIIDTHLSDALFSPRSR